jgi:hypothetical protein
MAKLETGYLYSKTSKDIPWKKWHFYQVFPLLVVEDPTQHFYKKSSDLSLIKESLRLFNLQNAHSLQSPIFQC